MASVGSILRREREKRRIQVAEVAAATKIPERYLRAIEKDDYSIFPAETYLVGFIRNYARELDLDANEIVSIYKNSRLEKDRMKNAPAVSFVVKETPPPPSVRAEPRRSPAKSVVPVMPSPDSEGPAATGRKGRGKATAVRKESAEAVAERSPSTGSAPWGAGLGRWWALLVRNPVAALSVAGGVLLVLVAILLVGLLRSCPKRSERESLARVQVIHFEQDTGVFDLNLNEYYRLRLGRDLVPVMGEVLSSSPDATVAVRLLFHIGRTQYELTPGLKKDLDLDMDGRLDIALQVNSISESSYNLSIFKLRAFSTNAEETSEATNAPRSQVRTGSGPAPNEAFTAVGTKKKIVFRAEVVQKTYVKAWVDTSEQEAKVYYPGQSFELVAQDAIQLRIGNPAGLKVTVNGVPVKLGGQGVVNKTIKWKRDLFDENLYTLVISDWQ